MAHVVGVTPDQLTAAGRGAAAEILREIERQEAAESGAGQIDPRVRMAMDILTDLPPRIRKEVLRRLGGDLQQRQVNKDD
ncbi:MULTISPECIES: hypothetical protein [unclassified Streptomyces]|uniref:hypothetical protein n=1 Tax=unclassified Streptomyces TaxID=2593676 RepID=UPI00343624C0